MSSITCTADAAIRTIELADAAREIVTKMADADNTATVSHVLNGLVVTTGDTRVTYEGDDEIAQCYLNALLALWGQHHSPMDLCRAIEDLHARLRRVRRDVSYDRSDLTHTVSMAWSAYNRRRESDPTLLIDLLNGQVIRREYAAT